MTCKVSHMGDRILLRYHVIRYIIFLSL
uniref:Uncharacterized protein n=1 Tax=Musa acuminata subsp. malaccensis TaxID=214687 RepID=A0A804JCU4_MUSAM